MADMNMKKTALQLLVVNGILTQDEVDKCIQAISDDSIVSIAPASVTCDDYDQNIVYEDNNISVTYKSMTKVSNLFFGDGISFKFIVHNKTNYDIRVNATDISVNDFIVSNSELICSAAAPKKKTIDNFSLYGRSLEDVDVEDVDDIYSLELAISYEIEALDIEREGDPVSIDV